MKTLGAWSFGRWKMSAHVPLQRAMFSCCLTLSAARLVELIRRPKARVAEWIRRPLHLLSVIAGCGARAPWAGAPIGPGGRLPWPKRGPGWATLRASVADAF